MEPAIKENTLLENLVNRLEGLSSAIYNQSELIEDKLVSPKTGQACSESVKSPGGLLDRLENVIGTLESANKNFTHVFDTLI